MAIDAREIKRRHERGVSNRHLWESVWQELADFEFPRRRLALRETTPGERQTDEMLDSTATFGAEVLAASLQSGLTNTTQKWLSLRTSDDALMKDDEVRLWLEDSTIRLLNAFQTSNLVPELGEIYLDLGVFGTGAVFLGEAPQDIEPLVGSFRGFRFQSYPIGSYTIEEDGFGQVNAIFLEVPMSARAVVDRWGEENVSNQMRGMAKDHPLDTVIMIYGVAPRKSMPGARTRLPWAAGWVEQKTTHLVSESGFFEFPFMVPRWSKSSGEVYGRGPGHTALPDVRSLNKLIELEMKALALAVLPPHKAKRSSVIGAVEFNPGGVTVVKDMGDIEPMNSAARFDVAKLDENEWRSSIRRVFFVDQLLQLLARETPAMTATEVQVKLQLLQQILGPAFGRLESGLLRPMVERGFKMMLRGGALLPPPLILRGQDVRVEFEGPLARGQRGQELLAIDRTLLTAQTLAGMGKIESLDNLDDDEILRLTSHISGAPASILRVREEVAQIREQRAQQQQQQQQLETLLAGSEAGKNIAPLAKIASGGGQTA